MMASLGFERVWSGLERVLRGDPDPVVDSSGETFAASEQIAAHGGESEGFLESPSLTFGGTA